MKRVLFGLAVVVGLGGSSTTAVAAQQTPAAPAPTVIPVSGQFVRDGQPVSGVVEIVLALYEGREDASPRWIESQTATLDALGRYDVHFGATLDAGLPAELFGGSPGPRWIGVTIQGVEQPRVMLVSVPYAAKAVEADTLAGRSASDFMLTSTFRDDLKSALADEGVRTGGSVGTAAVTTNYLQKGAAGGITTDATNVYETGGNLGVGTTSPISRLHVAGGFTYLAPTAASASQGLVVETSGLANGSNGVFVNAPSGWTGAYFKANLAGIEQFGFFHNGNGWFRGNFGAGTNTPAYRFHLVGGMAFLQPSAGSASQGLVVDTGSLPNGSNAIFVNAPGGWAGNYFKANVGGAETFAIAANGSAWFNGNLGVGTASPAAKLHVVGNATITGNVVVDGNIAAKYQDVAEWVDSAEPLEAGTVVIIDPTGRNRVMGASRAYESSVAGAVSPQPGLTLGEPGEGRVLVAQSGRVRVKADATYGAIRAGDLLVTSTTKGYVMKSQPIKVGGQLVHRPGTLVGKALEPLAQGQGEILVLLTLQ